MTIKQQGGIFGRNPTFNNVTVDGQTTFNSNITVQNDTAPKISILDSNNGFDAATFTSENGGRDLAIFAPQDIIFDQSGLETARFLDGGGLTFNGDTAAANALDDYEEGTWTPTLFGAGTAGSYTFTTQSGRYTKIGDVVYVTAQLTVDTVNTALTGNVRFGGWPYASNLDAGLRLMVTTSGVNWDSGTYLHFYGYFHASTVMQIRGVRDNANQSTLGSSAFTVGANDIVTITGFYFV
jgi:hypothetical protein